MPALRLNSRKGPGALRTCLRATRSRANYTLVYEGWKSFITMMFDAIYKAAAGFSDVAKAVVAIESMTRLPSLRSKVAPLYECSCTPTRRPSSMRCSTRSRAAMETTAYGGGIPLPAMRGMEHPAKVAVHRTVGRIEHVAPVPCRRADVRPCVSVE